jgi:pyruvate dehydrogenase (quinone)
MAAGEVLVDALIDWGSGNYFWFAGDGINGTMEALRSGYRRSDSSRFGTKSRPRSWSAPTRSTRENWVCLATSGPGGIHLLNGLYDAKLDGQPVLAITGMQFHDLIGTYTQPEVALDKVP